MGPQKWQEGDIEWMQEETSEVGITLLYGARVWSTKRTFVLSPWRLKAYEQLLKVVIFIIPKAWATGNFNMY